jgi:hypothetical protein
MKLNRETATKKKQLGKNEEIKEGNKKEREKLQKEGKRKRGKKKGNMKYAERDERQE